MQHLLFNNTDHETLVRGYDAWSADYDRDVRRMGCATPHAIAAAARRFLPHGNLHLLDVGAGTGLLGEELYLRGFRCLTGLDCSHGMLVQASGKGVYQCLCRMMLGRPLGMPDHCFDAVLAAGVFTPGHAPPETMVELGRIVKPGGWIIFSLKWDGTFEKAFLSLIRRLEKEAQWQKLAWSPPYRSWPDADSTLQARVLAYRVSGR